MNDMETAAVNYFRASGNYFWRWNDDDEVIEWRPWGPTLCTPDEINSVIKSLVPQGLPPLSPVLLLLAACQDNWHTKTNARVKLNKLINSLENTSCDDQVNIKGSNFSKLINSLNNLFIVDQSQNEITILLNKAMEFLELVHSLDSKFRTENTDKIRLVKTVFRNANNLIPKKESRGIIDHFSGKAYVTILMTIGENKNLDSLITDLNYLVKAFEEFPTKQLLENCLATEQNGPQTKLDKEGIL